MRHGGQPKGAPGSVGKSVQQKKGWFTMGLLIPGKILPRQILPGKMSTSCDSGMICNEESHWFPRIVCYFALENAEIPNEKILRGGWVIGKSEGLSGKIIKMMTGWFFLVLSSIADYAPLEKWWTAWMSTVFVDVPGSLDVTYSLLMEAAIMWMLRPFSGDFTKDVAVVRDDHMMGWEKPSQSFRWIETMSRWAVVPGATDISWVPSWIMCGSF